MRRFTVHKLNHREEGLAAFIVVGVLMLIISLVVISFTRIVRNEQEQTLDRQLSSRAFYAAESGVNMASKELDDPASSLIASGKSNCLSGGPFSADSYTIGDASNNTQVTCLTVDNAPGTLEYSDIAPGVAQTVPIDASGDIGDLQFSWQEKSANSSTDYSGCTGPAGAFKPVSQWNTDCPAPVLRVDIVPTSGALTRGNLSNNVATYYFHPTSGVSEPVPAMNAARGVSQGQVVGVQCDNSVNKHCNVAVTIPAAEGRKFHLRITSLYGASELKISPSNSGVEFRGAQVVIDSTGRAQDIIRRIQVRRPLGSNGSAPAFAIEAADGLCKRLLVSPGAGGTVEVAPSGADVSPTFNGGKICDFN